MPSENISLNVGPKEDIWNNILQIVNIKENNLSFVHIHRKYMNKKVPNRIL